MVPLKSETFKDYYGDNPNEYYLKFIHHNIQVLGEEYDKIKEDLDNIYNFDKESFLIYFSDIDNYNKIVNNIDIHNLYENKTYLRLRTKEEYERFKVCKDYKKVKVIVSLEDLEKLDITDLNLVIQIDKVSELDLNKLNSLLDRYNIKEILLGQIAYLTKEDLYLYEIMSKMYNIDSSNMLELEKMNKITNDIYSIKEYVSIMNYFKDVLSKLNIKDDLDGFYKIFNYIANEVYYDDQGVMETKIDNQNLKNAVFNKKSVCEGYSKLLEQMLSLIGIDSKIVQGGGKKEDGGHVWNQVNIDGKWYNADVTLASYSIHNNEEIKTCLVKDSSLLYKTNTSISSTCDEDYENSMVMR